MIHDWRQEIEERVGKRVNIISDEYQAAGRYLEQHQSPLFSILPRELRDLIWAYVTAPYEDPDAKFAATEYYYRPGHTAHLRSDTALLRTCRRIWLEANALPMLQAEHSFYFYREAPDRRNTKWMADLSDHNRQNFGTLRVFAQMFAIENLKPAAGEIRRKFLKVSATPGDFQPRVFQVTIRHTDWWHWEQEEPLRLHLPWVETMLNSPDLRSTQYFKLELETLDYKVDQLLPIIEQIKNLTSELKTTHIVDGKPIQSHFVLDSRVETYRWQGPTNINMTDYRPYEGKSVLDYQVMILTWRLRFPELPRASMPDLRRAPRVPEEPVNGAINGDEDDNLVPAIWVGPDSTREYQHRPQPPHHRRLARHRPLTWWSRKVQEGSMALHQNDHAIRRRQHISALSAHERKRFVEQWAANGSLLCLTD